MAKKRKSIPARTKALLWVESNNRCPICGEQEILIVSENEDQTEIENEGQIAHIVSLNQKIVRPNKCSYNYEHLKNPVKGKGKYTENELFDFKNLLIVCKKCHKKIDSIKYFWPTQNTTPFESAKALYSYKNKNFLLHLNETTKNVKEIDLIKEEMKNIKFIATNLEEFLIIEKNIKDFLEVLKGEAIKCNIKDVETLMKVSKKVQKTCNEIINGKNGREQSDAIKSIVEKLDLTKDLFVAYKNNNKTFKVNIQIKNIKFDKLINNNKNSFVFDFWYIQNKKTEVKNITKEQLKINIEKYSNKFDKNSWIINSPQPNDKIKNLPEYKNLKNLLLNLLSTYTNNNEDEKMQSASIAYMARWGTGKTTVVRKLYKELKDFFQFVEINLWNISNTISTEGIEKKDDLFIRSIVKEAITQILQDEKFADEFLNIKKNLKLKNNESDIESKILNKLLDIPEELKPIEAFRERSRFVDEFITAISSIASSMFEITQKPIVFIFDDMDRIENNKIVVKILDALISFMNIKNTLYIIPVDESIVAKAIFEIKNRDPYKFMNKYFTYSIKAPFIPQIEGKSIVTEITEEFKLKEKLQKFIKNDKQESTYNNWYENDFLQDMAILFPSTYRSIKDYINVFYTNCLTLNDKENKSFIFEIGKLKEMEILRIILFSTIIQIEFPLLVDLFAKSLKEKDILKNEFESIKKIVAYMGEYGLEIPEEYNNKGENKATKIEVNNFIWNAILMIDIPKNINNFWSLLKHVENNWSTKDGKENNKTKKFISSKIERLEVILNHFDYGTWDDNRLLYFWGIITMARINNKEIIDYIQNVEIETPIKNNKLSQWVDEDQQNKDIRKEKLNKYIQNMEKYMEIGIFSIEHIHSFIEDLTKNHSFSFIISNKKPIYKFLMKKGSIYFTHKKSLEDVISFFDSDKNLQKYFIDNYKTFPSSWVESIYLESFLITLFKNENKIIKWTNQNIEEFLSKINFSGFSNLWNVQLPLKSQSVIDTISLINILNSLSFAGRNKPKDSKTFLLNLSNTADKLSLEILENFRKSDFDIKVIKDYISKYKHNITFNDIKDFCSKNNNISLFNDLFENSVSKNKLYRKIVLEKNISFIQKSSIINFLFNDLHDLSSVLMKKWGGTFVFSLPNLKERIIQKGKLFEVLKSFSKNNTTIRKEFIFEYKDQISKLIDDSIIDESIIIRIRDLDTQQHYVDKIIIKDEKNFMRGLVLSDKQSIKSIDLENCKWDIPNTKSFEEIMPTFFKDSSYFSRKGIWLKISRIIYEEDNLKYFNFFVGKQSEFKKILDKNNIEKYIFDSWKNKDRKIKSSFKQILLDKIKVFDEYIAKAKKIGKDIDFSNKTLDEVIELFYNQKELFDKTNNKYNELYSDNQKCDSSFKQYKSNLNNIENKKNANQKKIQEKKNEIKKIIDKIEDIQNAKIPHNYKEIISNGTNADYKNAMMKLDNLLNELKDKLKISNEKFVKEVELELNEAIKLKLNYTKPKNQEELSSLRIQIKKAEDARKTKSNKKLKKNHQYK